ncbi:hypothetical protein DXT99_13595 [Pontibacter diazotrophicus]|uniref:Oxidase n=1 Tax=Pontibacter diazotrophicus TaxID=1400979 RepID=A0A3D8LBR4_9BACT|nr:hypothetical protein DXT99_13595 [Pontibacter diazotrophicus]
MPLVCLLLVLGTNIFASIPVGNFTREPVAVAGLPFYVGFISNMGMLFWCAAAVLCIFSWLVFRQNESEKTLSSFLLYFGLLTLALLFDDFFQLHDYIFLFYLPISEKLIFLSYGILMLSGLIIFRDYILMQTDFFVFFTAFVFLGLSIVVDSLQHQLQPFLGEDIRILLEDGFKFFGIVGWFGYFAKVCLTKFRASV